MIVCLPIEIYFLDRWVTPSKMILLWVSSYSFRSLLEFTLLEAIIWKISIKPEIFLRSGPGKTLLLCSPEDPLNDFIANSILEFYEFSMAVKIVLHTSLNHCHHIIYFKMHSVSNTLSNCMYFHLKVSNRIWDIFIIWSNILLHRFCSNFDLASWLFCPIIK